MSEHTPGPWHIHNGSPTTVVGPTGGWIAQLWKWATGKKMAEANARLIAAAPDLLQALKIARDALYPNDKDGMSMREWNLRMIEASTPIHDAIAKAEGK